MVKAVGERGKDVTLATFHSFCEALLVELDPNRVILDKCDHWILLRRNLARLRLEKYRRLPDPGQFLNDFLEDFPVDARTKLRFLAKTYPSGYADGLGTEAGSGSAVN